MPVIARTIALLVISNVFMTFAWYAHLRNLAQRPGLIALYMREPVRLNYLWAASCMCGADYFCSESKT